MTQPRRPDQQYLPPGTPVAPATAAGIFRGRQVIIFGTGPGTGLFIYDPAPGAGTLVGSATSAADSDQYGNPYAGPGFAVYSLTGGSGIEMILNGNIAELRFPSGYSGEDQVSRIVTSVLNSGGDFIQQLLAGPSISTAGHTDQAYLELDSSNGTDSAAGQLAYSDAAGNPHLYAFWSAEGVIIENGSITATDPSTGTVATPAIPETFHTVPALQNSWTQRNAVQSTYPLSSYWLDATGMLRMSLYLVAGTIANNTLLFTLGSDYIPSHTHIVPVETDKSGAGTDSTSGTPCIIIRGALEPSPGQVTVGNFNSLTTRINQGNISVPMTL